MSLGPKVGEVVIADSDRPDIHVDGINQDFEGFNRNPYIASFIVDGRKLLLVNCHLYYGSWDNAAEEAIELNKRILEPQLPQATFISKSLLYFVFMIHEKSAGKEIIRQRDYCPFYTIGRD